jgi:single-strand DNA-binding protein
MSGSLNLVVLVGRVGRDPEMRYSRSGDGVANLSVATTERWSKDGQKHEHTEWHRVEVWGGSSNFVRDYVVKGSLVLIEGSIRTEEYTGKDGHKRKATKIKARKVELLAGGKGRPDPVETDAEEAPDESEDAPF